MLRRDLAAVQGIAAAAAAGEPAEQVRHDLSALQTSGPLLRLKANCLGYCQLVHSHHSGEDSLLFPAVRRAAPHLAATIDRLEADHRAVSDLLDRIEAAAHDLGHVTTARARLVAALDLLSTHLHDHLAFEERSLAPVLGTWTHRPSSSTS